MPELRLLVLAPFPPQPDAAHGGSRMMALLVGGLAARHRVALLCLRSPDEPGIEEGIAHRCRVAEAIERPAPPRPLRQARVAAGLVAGRPAWATKWWAPAFAARVRELASSFRPDVVQIEYPVMGRYLPALEGCPAPRVLTVYEPAAAASRERLDAASGVRRRLSRRLDHLAWGRFERRVLAGVQAAVALTGRDREALEALGTGTPIVIIPLAATLPVQPSSPTGDLARARLLFVGNFRHPPNVDAALWLAHGIFPRIKKRHPGAFLHLVGDAPPPELARLGGPSIGVTGLVPDLAPFLDRAAVVVAPLRQGGGMRVKVLEALAAGKAVVATPLAVAGLDVAHERELLLGSGTEEIVEAVLRLLASPDERAALAGRARAWAEGHLGPARTVAAYEMLYAALLPETAAAAPHALVTDAWPAEVEHGAPERRG